MSEKGRGFGSGGPTESARGRCLRKALLFWVRVSNTIGLLWCSYLNVPKIMDLVHCITDKWSIGVFLLQFLIAVFLFWLRGWRWRGRKMDSICVKWWSWERDPLTSFVPVQSGAHKVTAWLCFPFLHPWPTSGVHLSKYVVLTIAAHTFSDVQCSPSTVFAGQAFGRLTLGHSPWLITFSGICSPLLQFSPACWPPLGEKFERRCI